LNRGGEKRTNGRVESVMWRHLSRIDDLGGLYMGGARASVCAELQYQDEENL
jgi:hypothetical protein